MRIIPLDAAVEPQLAPDLLWNGTSGDLALTSLADPVNPGGLRAQQQLATAVLICLQTDRRVEATELPAGESNRGWPGDAFDLQPGEVPLGSKLWLLRRRALTDGIEIEAEDYAREALQTLIDQRAVVRWDVAAAADRPNRRLTLAVQGYGRDGRQMYQSRYAVLWDQLDGVSDPLAG